MDTKKNKISAIAFQKLVVEGKVDEAYEAYVSPIMQHHNASFSSDIESLKQGMKENYRDYPNKKFDHVRVIAEDDLVMVHSRIRLKPEDLGMGAVHIFRFDDGKIIEMWDVGQEVPEDMPNENGMF